MEPIYDSCVSLMPELKGLNLEIHELKGGITNRLYRIRSTNGHDYVFRFYGAKTELFIDRDVETENLRRLEPLGVTPRVIKYLPDQGVTVVEFIPGYVLKNQDFLKEDLWELIVRPIKIIHRSGINLSYTFDPLAEVKRFYRILQETNTEYPEFDIHGTIKLLEKISDMAKVIPSHYVPCHNDLLADNFILTEGRQEPTERMCLIDWEYGAMAPCYYDIADMFQEILVPKAVEKKLLTIYWEDRDMDYHEHMTDLFKPYPDVYWFLWSLIQLNISTIPFDYYTYGKVKFENAHKNIEYLKVHHHVRI
jgi:thiamine kinase-like enzyme